MYGGDEVGALVFDVGSYTTRVGYAGEDTPKADVPTVIGVGPQMETPMETGDKEGSAAVPQRKYYIDNTFIHVPREGVEMVSPMKDGCHPSWGTPSPPLLWERG